ncbi:diguanylate cyclase [Nitrosophilus alvini]|uniref:sensor domain-containing diguanylate cyclase n=1 Tax=Nitrosophilus alvini TaxID=2714855 RepID=UPI00190DB53E|nr:diguanylate cyclase [Nitrosophilus alvini]
MITYNRRRVESEIKELFKNRFAILIILIIAIFFFIYTFIYGIKKQEVERILSKELRSEKEKITLQINTLYASTRMLYELMLDKEIKKILSKAETDPVIARTLLYKKLLKNYKILKKYGLRQLHFHTPDGRSFLRFHKPQKYGDNLYDFRYSVNYVMKNKKPVYGFEIGRYHGGFRNIFPIFSESKKYLGNMEISFSFEIIRKNLEKPLNYYFMILDKNIVMQTVPKSEFYHYRICYLNPNFLIEETNSEKCKIIKKLGLRLENPDYLEKAIYKEKNGKDYIISFIPIESISGAKNGYIVNIKLDNKEIIKNEENFKRTTYLLILLTTITILVLFIVKKLLNVRSQAHIDELTQTFNRRGCQNEIKKFINSGKNSLILFDIDNFKTINDRFGHQTGDEVLKKIAEIVKRYIRKDDILCRFGGEEFLVFLPETSFEDSVVIAEKLRSVIENSHFGKAGKVTASFGISAQKNKESLEKLFMVADKKLYEAKKAGKNRVVY